MSAVLVRGIIVNGQAQLVPRAVNLTSFSLGYIQVALFVLHLLKVCRYTFI